METRYQTIDKVKEAARKELSKLDVGDKVIRVLAGSISMPLIITEITQSRIHCGPYEFDRRTGAEIDEVCGWDNHSTGAKIYPYPKKVG